MLINIGYTLSRSVSDYFVMHDVDLLPLNDDLSYRYPSGGPLHIASPELHPLYHYKKFVGGIMMMTNDDFEKVSGYTLSLLALCDYLATVLNCMGGNNILYTTQFILYVHIV